MGKLKVYVEEGAESRSVKSMFIDEGYIIVPKISNSDIVCLIGGADISPIIYDQENTASHVDESFDIQSLGVLTLADMYNKPVVGICRGGQLLNCWWGGELIQHMEGHQATTHPIIIPQYSEYTYYDGCEVTSDHHQRMLPPDHLEHYAFYSPDSVAEVVVMRHRSFYFAYQPHPEWCDKDSDCRRLFFAILENEYNYFKQDEGN